MWKRMTHEEWIIFQMSIQLNRSLFCVTPKEPHAEDPTHNAEDDQRPADAAPKSVASERFEYI